MLSRRKLWMDGKLVPFDRANVHIMSHSFGRGSAIFEVMSLHETAKGPAVFRLDDHIRRLKRSAEAIRMKLPYGAARIKAAVKETVKAGKVRSGFIKLICYYGGVEFEVVPRKPKVSMAVLAVDPLADLDAERFRKATRRPATVTVSEWRKIDPRTVPVECKSAANYLGGMVAKLDAIEKGFTGPVLLDTSGYVAEGATESVFLVKNRTLKTPALGNVLSGITRRTVLDIAGDIGIKAVEKKMRPRELFEADEVFLTSSVVKIWPVSRVEDRELDAPGEFTRLLDRVMDKVCAGKARSYMKWLTVIS